MFRWCFFALVFIILETVHLQEVSSDREDELTIWEGSWKITPTSASSWSLRSRIPMTPEFDEFDEGRKGKLKMKKKLKKFILPLLLAYKLKFFTLIPVLIGGLILLTAATGTAGFFFALFAAAMGLKSGWHH